MEKMDMTSVQGGAEVPTAPLGLSDVLHGPQKAGAELRAELGSTPNTGLYPQHHQAVSPLAFCPSWAPVKQTQPRLINGVGHRSQRGTGTH